MRTSHGELAGKSGVGLSVAAFAEPMNLPVEHAVLNSFGTAVAGGVALTMIARKLNLPAIILLLAGGIALGPEFVGLVQPDSIETVLPTLVSLAVGVILFEGGLTLDLRGFSRGSTVITRLLSLGVVVTWLGCAAVVWWLFETSVSLALLAGSLVIVTGPTVISPLLKRIKIRRRLHGILHWEGVLIDAIGVFIAILCFEWFADRNEAAAFYAFGLRVASGLALGALGGFLFLQMLRRHLVPDNLLNLFALGAAVLIFVCTEAIISEAGLLAVTLAGFIVGWKQPPQLKQIRQFKAEITDLLIGMLFILLAARLDLAQFGSFGMRGVVAVAMIMLLVRPLNVFVCTLGSPLSWKEKLFLSWVAPRGIVAASMASLFVIALDGETMKVDPKFLETFTYSVIVATVVIQGFTAGGVARFLGLQRPEPTGWMIVSADLFSRRVARFLREVGDREVLVVDTNVRLISEARSEGLLALTENALDTQLAEERVDFQGIGNLLALTDNSELNELICHRWEDKVGKDNAYRWQGMRSNNGPAQRPDSHGRVVFPKMSRPSVVAAEISDRNAQLSTISLIADPPVIDGTPLIAVREKKIFIISTAEQIAQLKKGDQVLVLRRVGGFLNRAIEAGAAMEVEAASLEEIYEAAIATLVQRQPGLSKGESFKDITAPGKVVPTLLGHGVAIPHLYSTTIERRACVLVRLKKPLRVPEQEEAIELLFFLVSPAGDPEGHLATMGEIARLCSDEAALRELFKARDVKEAEAALRGTPVGG